MNIKINELRAHMEQNGLERVAVEVVDVNVPNIEHKYYKQKPRVLAKRLIIFSVEQWNDIPHRIHYAMYNSFKRGQSYLPSDFAFDILEGEDAGTIFTEYDEHIQGIEKSFRDVFNQTHADIQAKLEEASKLIREAEALSEESGIPFRPKKSISGFKMSYVPKSFTDKFGDDDIIHELSQDLTGAYGSPDGWQTSQTC